MVEGLKLLWYGLFFPGLLIASLVIGIILIINKKNYVLGVPVLGFGIFLLIKAFLGISKDMKQIAYQRKHGA